MKRKELRQTKANKKVVYGLEKDLIETLAPFKSIEMATMIEKLCKDNRTIRDKVSLVACFYPIVSLSTEKGYVRLGNINDLSQEDMNKYVDMVDHQINDYKARIKQLKRRMKPLIAWKEWAKKNGSAKN